MVSMTAIANGACQRAAAECCAVHAGMNRARSFFRA